MEAALAGVTPERVGAVLESLGLALSSIAPFATPFPDGDNVAGECSFEPGLVHGPVPQRRFANNAIFSVAAASGSGEQQPLILRICNTHAWRRGRMTSNEVASMRWAAAHGVPHIPRVLAFSTDAAESPLGCEFILMERLPGRPLRSLLEEAAEEKRRELRAKIAPQLREWLATLAAVPRPPGGSSGGPLASLRIADDGAVLADRPGWFHHELPPLGEESCAGLAALTSAVLRDCIARLRSEPDSREAAERALQAVEEPEDEALLAIVRYWRANPPKGDHADRLQWCEVLQRVVAEDCEAYRESYEPEGVAEQWTRLCHNDLCANNILVEDGRLVGVVDWESAMWGLTDKDCEEFGEIAATSDAADCGSGLPVAPGAAQRRRLMGVIGGVKCLYHSNASWYSWCNEPLMRAAMDLRRKVKFEEVFWQGWARRDPSAVPASMM